MSLEIDPQVLLNLVSRVLVKKDQQKLLNIGAANVTENWFHKRYS